MNILIAEDEEKISDIIKAFLESEGYTVFQSFDGQDTLEIYKREKIDLIVLDIMMPKIDGSEICSRIRSESNVPIIMLTARSSEDDKVEGLSIGADDYITKPFSNRELVERVKALLRRSYSDIPRAQSYVFNDGKLELDLERGIALKDGQSVELTGSELKILRVFLANIGKIFNRDELIDRVFGADYYGSDRTIDAHIKNIRHKIEDNPKKPEYIVTVYGMGYRFGGKK